MGRNRLEGEYLRRHPFGTHAAEAVGVIKATADQLMSALKPGTAYQFDKKNDCGDVTLAIDVLTAAAQGTRGAGRDDAISSLAALRKICGP